MKAIILKCRPRARFHFGKVAPDNNTSLNDTSEWIPSDTLFSALINILATAFDKPVVDKIINHFDAGHVRISSGFYLLRLSDRDIYFLPKPAHIALEVTGNFKKYNKVKFISRTVWEEGWPFSEWEDKCYFLQNGSIVVAKSEVPELASPLSTLSDRGKQESSLSKIKIYSIHDFPRVKTHAQGSQDAFFYLSTVCIADEADLSGVLEGSVHFYFLLENAPELERTEEFKALMTAISLLPDQGIGGERSAGCGLFDGISISDFEPFKISGASQQCSLSLTLPKDEQELHQVIAYQIQTRGGRAHQGGKLNFIRMMTEGAVALNSIEGKIAAIGNPVASDFLRYGKSFCLPVRSIH